MLTTAKSQPLSTASKKLAQTKNVSLKGFFSQTHNYSLKSKEEEQAIIRIEPVASPSSEKDIEAFGKAFVEGSPSVAEVLLDSTDSSPVVPSEAPSTPASSTGEQIAAQRNLGAPADGQSPAVLDDPALLDSATKDGANQALATDELVTPETVSITGDRNVQLDEPDDQIQAIGDDDAGQDFVEVIEEVLADGVVDLPIGAAELSQEQIAKIVSKAKKLLGDSAKAKKEVVDHYGTYAQAWIEATEYGYRGQDAQEALDKMKRYLDAELPEMLKQHSGRVARGWRVNLWALAAGGAGLLPYGKPVVSAVARLRTKQIISEKFAIARIKTDKARAKEAKEAKKAKKSSTDKKKEQAKQIVGWATQQAASQLAAELVAVPVDAVSDAFTEAMHEAAQSAVGEAVSEFFSDLRLEMFFGSAAELIHFLPMVGQAYSAYQGYRRTARRCKEDIQSAVKTAMDEHGKTIIPVTTRECVAPLSNSPPHRQRLTKDP